VKPAYLVAFFILLGSLGFTLYSFRPTPYVNVAQARERPGETLQVQGKILKETVKYEITNGRGQLTFEIMDKHNHRMQVVYPQAKPENFDEATNVDAIGRFEDGVFRAHTLLVKCPSKYSDEQTKPGEKPAGAQSGKYRNPADAPLKTPDAPLMKTVPGED
jgi:cytochrome c-type biogenesis protein CcmE